MLEDRDYTRRFSDGVYDPRGILPPPGVLHTYTNKTLQLSQHAQNLKNDQIMTNNLVLRTLELDVRDYLLEHNHYVIKRTLV